MDLESLIAALPEATSQAFLQNVPLALIGEFQDIAVIAGITVIVLVIYLAIKGSFGDSTDIKELDKKSKDTTELDKEFPGPVTYKNIKDNANLVLLGTSGCFSVYERQQDMNTEFSLNELQLKYFTQKMNIRRRQVLAELNGNGIKLKEGVMQWIAGNVSSEWSLGCNPFNGKVTSSGKPKYSGNGAVMLEPTYEYILFENPAEWGSEGIVVQNSMFLACDAHLQDKWIIPKKLSGLMANKALSIQGEGTLVIESPVPRKELIEFNLDNGVLKIDGNLAIAWSGTLQMTVERSSKTLLGSLANGEGAVNVYRGTGKVLMTPTVPVMVSNSKNA